MMENVVLKNARLAKFIAEFEEDVQLDVASLREKSMRCSSIWAKWLSYLFQEREAVSKISEAKRQLVEKRMTANQSRDSLLKAKAQERIQETDPTARKLDELAKSTRECVDYIERALGILQNFGFSIKNAVDVLKLTAN